MFILEYRCCIKHNVFSSLSANISPGLWQTTTGIRYNGARAARELGVYLLNIKRTPPNPPDVANNVKHVGYAAASFSLSRRAARFDPRLIYNVGSSAHVYVYTRSYTENLPPPMYITYTARPSIYLSAILYSSSSSFLRAYIYTCIRIYICRRGSRRRYLPRSYFRFVNERPQAGHFRPWSCGRREIVNFNPPFLYFSLRKLCSIMHPSRERQEELRRSLDFLIAIL